MFSSAGTRRITVSGKQTTASDSTLTWQRHGSTLVTPALVVAALWVHQLEGRSFKARSGVEPGCRRVRRPPPAIVTDRSSAANPSRGRASLPAMRSDSEVTATAQPDEGRWSVFAFIWRFTRLAEDAFSGHHDAMPIIALDNLPFGYREGVVVSPRGITPSRWKPHQCYQLAYPRATCGRGVVTSVESPRLHGSPPGEVICHHRLHERVRQLLRRPRLLPAASAAYEREQFTISNTETWPTAWHHWVRSAAAGQLDAANPLLAEAEGLEGVIRGDRPLIKSTAGWRSVLAANTASTVPGRDLGLQATPSQVEGVCMVINPHAPSFETACEVELR